MKINSKFITNKESSFWEHLEVLRWTIFRILIVLVVLMVVSFSLKDFIFNNIFLPPLTSDFKTYKILCLIGEYTRISGFCAEEFQIQLININLSGQFMVHMISSMLTALVMSVPYILYEIWLFVKPALYPKEKKNVGVIFLSTSFLFYLGALISYFVVFPFTLRFLGTYQVSDVIINQVSIQSYMNTLAMLVLFMGLSFELPVIAYLLSNLGILNKSILKRFRKYAFVAILIISAIITPTADPFTMLIVAIPIYLLYELSILVCKSHKPIEEEEELEEELEED